MPIKICNLLNNLIRHIDSHGSEMVPVIYTDDTIVVYPGIDDSSDERHEHRLSKESFISAVQMVWRDNFTHHDRIYYEFFPQMKLICELNKPSVRVTISGLTNDIYQSLITGIDISSSHLPICFSIHIDPLASSMNHSSYQLDRLYGKRSQDYNHPPTITSIEKDTTDDGMVISKESGIFTTSSDHAGLMDPSGTIARIKAMTEANKGLFPEPETEEEKEAKKEAARNEADKFIRSMMSESLGNIDDVDDTELDLDVTHPEVPSTPESTEDTEVDISTALTQLDPVTEPDETPMPPPLVSIEGKTIHTDKMTHSIKIGGTSRKK